MIENPYRKGSEPRARIHAPTPRKNCGLFSWFAGTKINVLILLMALCILTFYLHGTSDLLLGGSALMGSLRGSKSQNIVATTDDPVVVRDRLQAKKSSVTTHTDTAANSIKTIPHGADIIPSDQDKEDTSEKEKLAREEKEAKDKLALTRMAAEKNELERLRMDAQVARAEAARLRQEAVDTKALRELEKLAIDAAQIKLEAEERRNHDQHHAELTRQEEEAHRRDNEEQQHMQPVKVLTPPKINKDIKPENIDHTLAGSQDPLTGNPLPANNLPTDYINPYDPKPGHVAYTKKKTEPLQIVCDGSMDPFENLPIDSYIPPEKSSLKNKLEWKDKQSAMMQRIRKFPSGGKPLVALIDKEVREMSVLRMELFCQDALDLFLSKQKRG